MEQDLNVTDQKAVIQDIYTFDSMMSALINHQGAILIVARAGV